MFDLVLDGVVIFAFSWYPKKRGNNSYQYDLVSEDKLICHSSKKNIILYAMKYITIFLVL